MVQAILLKPDNPAFHRSFAKSSVFQEIHVQRKGLGAYWWSIIRFMVGEFLGTMVDNGVFCMGNLIIPSEHLSV